MPTLRLAAAWLLAARALAAQGAPPADTAASVAWARVSYLSGPTV